MAPVISDLRQNVDSSWNYHVIVTFLKIRNFSFSIIRVTLGDRRENRILIECVY